VGSRNALYMHSVFFSWLSSGFGTLVGFHSPRHLSALPAVITLSVVVAIVRSKS
jgi:hypothetical protein